MMSEESTLSRIYKARQDISKKYEHDPYRLVEHYIEFQKQFQNRLVSTQNNTDKQYNKEK
jgi:hypothetical protein